MSNSNTNNLRRSKRLSSRGAFDPPQDPEWTDDGSDSLHRSAQKSRRIQRAPLGDITRGLTNRPNTRSSHRSPLVTGIDTSNMAFFSISSVRDIDSDAERHDLDATKIDDDEEDDAQSLDGSFDEDDMLFSANKQRQEHEKDLAIQPQSSKLSKKQAKHTIEPLHTSIDECVHLAIPTDLHMSPLAENHDQSTSRSLHIDPSDSSNGSQPMDTLFSPLGQIVPLHQPPAWSTHDCLKENGDMLYRYLRRSEDDDRFQCNPGYMTETQTDLSFAMRAILIDWLVEVCEEYSLSTQTLLLGVGYLDRFLSIHEVDRSRLQLIGVTSIFIASKYWEIKPPLVDDFVYISDHSYSREQVLEMERCLLNSLHFNLAAPTCWDFHRRYLSLLGMFSPDLEHFGDMCMELILCEPASLSFKPSEVAAAALLYAHWVVDGTFWTVEHTQITQYHAEDLNNCVSLMEVAHMKQWHQMQSQQQANGRAVVPLKAVMIKYSKPIYNRVALTQAHKPPPE